MSDSVARVIQRIAYAPYGTPKSALKPARSRDDARFTGQVRDSGASLYYFGARYHEPALGRFLSPDAARQASSPYAYVGAAPLERVDPDGNMYGEYVRRALSFAAHARGLDYRHIADPIIRLEVAREAAAYAYQRRLDIATRMGTLEAGMESNSRGPTEDAIHSTLQRERLYFNILRSWADDARRELVAGLHDPHLSTRARHITPRVSAAQLKGFIPEYGQMLSAIDSSTTYEQQLCAVTAACRRFDELFQKSTHRTMLLGRIRTDRAVASSLAHHSVAGMVRRTAQYRMRSRLPAFRRMNEEYARLRRERERWIPYDGDELFHYREKALEDAGVSYETSSESESP